MAKGEGWDNATQSQKEEGQKTETNPEDPNAKKSSSFSSEDSDSDYDSDYSSDDEGYEAGEEDEQFRKSLAYRRAIDESNAEKLQAISEALDSERLKRKQEEQMRRIVYDEDLFDFPKDPEKWTEEDLREFWADAPMELKDPGWDPAFVDEEDWEFVQEELEAGRKPPIAPFYVPYRKPYPPIVKSHPDIKTPKSAIEELDRIEEFLRWVSYVFEDGSSYEGTVWDDLAHGKGVYVAEQGLVRYEGEWLQNNPEGHGVIEVDIPVIEPVPGSKLEAKMRKEGKILAMDYMTPEDREWLEMDIEDSYRLADGEYEIPFYENDEWVRQFGRKPEKGRYRYAGQWKHGRMHGCGVYEVNERTVYGRFYFGELLDESEGCDEETTALHSGIAEVAAAKARMFVNKPDGMVREERGPYGDPQHPYFYEGEDVWMAPGFINQFYEVPDYWKTYVHEVDQEREMWLNSFYKAPLRIPMPAELEYWWSNYETPEFILINKEPEPDPEDPSKLIYTEDPLILHTPTGQIINYVEDEEHGIRLFWQPPLGKDEDVDPEKVQFLPLGYDEFFGREDNVKKENILVRLIVVVENACKSIFDKFEKWAEEKRKACEMKRQEIDQEIELIEAELRLEEAIGDLDELLRREEKEEQEKVEKGLPDEEDTTAVTNQDEKAPSVEGEEEGEGDKEEEEEGEEDDKDLAQSSFGSVEQDQATGSMKGKKPGESPFATSSLSFTSSSLLSGVPIKLQQSFSLWKKGGSKPELNPPSCFGLFTDKKTVDSVYFRPVFGRQGSLKAVGQSQGKFKARSHLERSSLGVRSSSQIQSSLALENSKSNSRKSRLRDGSWLQGSPERGLDSILSLQIPVHDYETCRDTT